MNKCLQMLTKVYKYKQNVNKCLKEWKQKVTNVNNRKQMLRNTKKC